MKDRFSSDRGEAMVGYALVALLIAVASVGALKSMGDSTSDSFESVATSMPGQSVAEPELTPLEKWEQAKADYTDALADARTEKAAQIATAKAEYQAQVAENKSLPKPKRKAANKEAKADFNAAKQSANNQYKAAVAQAKADRNAAKAEYNATK